MQFKCGCGFRISENDKSVSKGGLLGSRQRDKVYADLAPVIDAFLAAIKAGIRNPWIRSSMGPDYPLTISDSAVISDLITFALVPVVRNYYRCPQCGRIHIDATPGGNTLISFSLDPGQNIDGGAFS